MEALIPGCPTLNDSVPHPPSDWEVPKGRGCFPSRQHSLRAEIKSHLPSRSPLSPSSEHRGSQDRVYGSPAAR